MAAVPHARTTMKTVALWIPTVLLALLFASTAFDKLTGAALPDFARWGYPTWFMVVVGIVELASAALLFVPRFAAFGAAGLSVVLLGALATIMANAEYERLPVTLIALLLALTIGWARRRN